MPTSVESFKYGQNKSITDHDVEFGSVQGDDFHGGDDLAGLLDLPSSNKVEVGLFHQMLHVVL